MILSDVVPFRGQHCETTTLGVLLGNVDVHLSEPMLFGLGEGLGFIYWDATYMPFPFMGGRSSPGAVATALTRNLGLELRRAETTSPTKAWRNVCAAIDAGTPVGLQLDSYHLDYVPDPFHFGGHMVAMYGYDDTDAYLVDTAPLGGTVRTSLTSLAEARASRVPMAARHLSFTVHREADPPELRDVLPGVLERTAESFLDPPIATLGHRGIDTASRRVLGWLERSSDPARDLPGAASVMESGGTGGGLFRRIFADFLAEAREHVDLPGLPEAQERYRAAADKWTEVAGAIAEAGLTGDGAHLATASGLLREIGELERGALRALAKAR